MIRQWFSADEALYDPLGAQKLHTGSCRAMEQAVRDVPVFCSLTNDYHVTEGAAACTHTHCGKGEGEGGGEFYHCLLLECLTVSTEGEGRRLLQHVSSLPRKDGPMQCET